MAKRAENSKAVAWRTPAASLGFAPPAGAQYYGPAVPPGEVYGRGCYWFRGHHYCNRYCYLEIDGYHYCQRRLFDAASQAAPPVVAPPPYGYTPPRGPYAARRYGPPPPERRKAPPRP